MGHKESNQTNQKQSMGTNAVEQTVLFYLTLVKLYSDLFLFRNTVDPDQMASDEAI